MSGTDVALVVIDGAPLADSRNVAAVLGVEHESITRLVYSRSEDLGTIRFEIGTSKMPDGRVNPKPEKYALLTKRQCLLLITFVRNSEEAVKAKVALIDAFEAMEKALGSSLGAIPRIDTEVLATVIRETIRAVFAETRPAQASPEPAGVVSEFEKPVSRERVLLSGLEVSALLGITRANLYQWRKSGRLLPVFPTGPLVYSARDVYAILDAQGGKAQATAPAYKTRPSYEKGLKALAAALLNPERSGHIASLLGMTPGEVLGYAQVCGLNCRSVFNYAEARLVWGRANEKAGGRS